MVAVALLLPPFMLCVVLALGRYEERLLSGRAPERPAQPRRRLLRAVPDLTAGRTPDSRRAPDSREEALSREETLSHQAPDRPAGRPALARLSSRGRGRHAA
ncbi:hypothetical protein B7P34_23105 [Streptosporangium nondiastaticum]|uniref:Uncharacterized protein n=1 Tax=Streptosporangium nondiastaticum TaxID=35764 RepID=A0A9X7JMA7_9ACTN|nr:hypothetical protein B7P34_23105 [Streptosporangium nondiastaticum]